VFKTKSSQDKNMAEQLLSKHEYIKYIINQFYNFIKNFYNYCPFKSLKKTC